MGDVIMEIRHAAKSAFHNRSTMLTSEHCGCYCCLAEFSPGEIKEWTDEGQTALCPFCSVDAVLTDGPDCVISKNFLQTLHNFWF